MVTASGLVIIDGDGGDGQVDLLIIDDDSDGVWHEGKQGVVMDAA